MMFIVIYGNMVMRSVIEEKTNRIIEIIISSVKPFQLMMGKIIGTSLAGVLQFIIWAILGFTFLTLSSVFFGTQATATPGLSPELMQTAQHEMSSSVYQYIQELWNLPIATILISFVVYFIGGYFLYSSFYAAIGAAVDNETDSLNLAHRDAHAYSIWCTHLANRVVDGYFVCDLLFGGLVCGQDLPHRHFNVRQKTNMERVIPLVEILIN